MAFGRYPFHPPTEYVESFTRPVPPVGYPNRAIPCGKSGCTIPALVWLTEEESLAYEAGVRLFPPPADACPFGVQ